MKRIVIAAVIVIGALFWAKRRFIDPPKPKEQSKAEMMAESIGRIAKAKRDGKEIDPKDLKVFEKATAALSTAAQQQQTPGATPAAAQDALQSMLAAATSTAPPEQRAKQRVQEMMELLQAGGQGVTMAAVIWQTGMRAIFNGSVDDTESAFGKFLAEKSIPSHINSFQVGDAYRRNDGSRRYTVVDVTIDGAQYHMGVPEKTGPIFWTF